MADDFNRARDVFEWNKRVFAVMGVWPLQSTYVKFTVWIVYLLIHMSMEFVDLFDVFGNLELMVLNLSESTLEVMIFVKLMAMRFSTTLVKLMRHIIEEIDTKLFENVEEKEIYLGFNRVAKKFFRLWLIMGVTTAVVYHMKPLEFRLKSDFTHCKCTILCLSSTHIFYFLFLFEPTEIFAVLQNESLPFVLPYRARLFFEVNSSPVFWLVWIYQSPMICMSIFHTATIGYLFSLVLHVCGQLSVLTFRIKNLDLDAWNSHESSRGIFRDIVNRHRNVLGLARDINQVFGLLLLEELLITTLLIGLTSYSVLVNVDFEETAVFLSFLLYGATMLLLIYGYCVAGEYLITESTNLYGAYYECQWCDMPDSFKKQLIICMIGASKPIQLTGGGFYIFSSMSFTSILKTSAGYISMLRTMI